MYLRDRTSIVAYQLEADRSEPIRLPLVQRHPEERPPLNLKNEETHILPCYRLGSVIWPVQNQSPAQYEHAD